MLHAAEAGIVDVGGLPVRRLGFGALRLPGVTDRPPDAEAAHAVLRRAVELGVDFIDTADVYGEDGLSERLIAEALHPYPPGLAIATKGGIVRGGVNGRPEYLRAACERSLERLRLERIDVYQLHRPDPATPIEESVGALGELRAEGKIGAIGVSNVDVALLQRARSAAPIVSVQNRYSLAERESESVLRSCERTGVAFMPWSPLVHGTLARPGGALGEVAARHGVTPAQVALAWLLHRSPLMLLIPGTGSVEHLEENVAAASLRLSEDDLARLTG